MVWEQYLQIDILLEREDRYAVII